METQSAYDTNITHQHGEGEDDQQHEKQSVLKKVKAKAKKIKDTIKKHGPGHHHDHGHDQYHEGHIPDDHDLDEEDDDDEEEIVQDPEVHGAPMYESAAAKNVLSGQPEEVSRPGITNFDRSDALPTHPLESTERSENYYTGNHGTKDNDPPNSTFSAHGAPMYESAAAKTVAPGQPEDLSRPGITDFETPKTLPTDPLASRERSENYYTGNYETKHNDPPHSAVSGLEAPLGREQPRVDFGKTTATVEEPLAPQNTPLPSSYQVKEENPTKTFVHGGDEYNPGQQKVNLQRPKGLEEDDAAPKDTFEPYTTTNYQTKVTDSTGEGGEATGIAPLLHSMDKMKIYDEQGTGRGPNLPSATQARASDLPFSTGTHDQFSPEPTRRLRTEPTPQEPTHNVDKPSNQSSYTEKISSATSAIADKAVSAKNIVASKLGYGEKDQAQFQSPTTDTTKQASAMDYGKKVAATVTEKLSPVYKKAAGAGSTVVSKIHGPGSGIATEVETEQHVQDQDKGVSVKSYIADKFKPGEEDRALSEVISEALQKRKEDSPEAEKETRARGKVTESEEVARRLGTGDETTERAGSGSMNSPTQSVVDKLKGAVGSWFGKPEGPQGTQQAHSASYADNTDSSADGRTLQESGN